jgi:predicted outer membrane repeat protein
MRDNAFATTRPMFPARLRIVLLAILLIPRTAHASVIVVGDGMPASCTASALQDALAAAASGPEYTIVRFYCGDEPLTIRLSFDERTVIPDRTTLDGGDRVTINSGRGFVIGADSSVTILRLGLTSGPGFVAIRNDGTLEVRRSAITDNAGPGIENRGGTVSVSDTVFARGRGDSGSAIVGRGTLRVDHSIFVDNRSKYGGAIQTSGVLEAKNSVFRRNGSEAGAIIHSGDATIQNCEFTQNSGDRGGAILHSGGTLTIKNSTFVQNNARLGGAIYGDSLTVEDSEFYDNSATTNGGAIFNAGCESSLLMINSVVMRNSARVGGGIWAVTEPVLKHSTVADNLPDDIAVVPYPPGICAPR